MIILWIPPSDTNEIRVDLQQLNLVIDPRPIGYDANGWTFKCLCTIGSTYVLFSRTDKNEGWQDVLRFRVYNSAEGPLPDFNSTTYMYYGLDGEQAPSNTVVGKVHPSVRIIRESAFINCDRMHSCIMGDGVEMIELSAFSFCTSLRVIRLSRTLRRIAKWAFLGCVSINTVLLPATLLHIEEKAFELCNELRILPLDHMDLDNVGNAIAEECTILLSINGVEQYEFSNARATNNQRVHRSIQRLHLNLPPFHKVCLDAFIDVPKIRDAAAEDDTWRREHNDVRRRDHNGMTPLHILAMNPYATPEVIVVCLQADPSAVCVEDNRGCNVIHYLEKHNVEGLVAVIEELCMYVSASLDDGGEETEGTVIGHNNVLVDQEQKDQPIARVDGGEGGSMAIDDQEQLEGRVALDDANGTNNSMVFEREQTEQSLALEDVDEMNATSMVVEQD